MANVTNSIVNAVNGASGITTGGSGGSAAPDWAGYLSFVVELFTLDGLQTAVVQSVAVSAASVLAGCPEYNYGASYTVPCTFSKPVNQFNLLLQNNSTVDLAVSVNSATLTVCPVSTSVTTVQSDGSFVTVPGDIAAGNGYVFVDGTTYTGHIAKNGGTWQLGRSLVNPSGAPELPNPCILVLDWDTTIISVAKH